MTKLSVLELNNVDIYGKRFNGYSLQKYLNTREDFSSKLLVNHKLGNDENVVNLFSTDELSNYDWKIETIEEKLGIKNQISVSEDALTSHPLYAEADILHFHMYHNMHLPIEFLTRIPKDKKIVIDVHDTFWLTDDKTPMLEVFRFSDQNKESLNKQRKRVLNSIDADFVVHSPFILDLFKKSSVTKNLRVHLIPFGIDTNVFKPMDRAPLLKKYGISKGSFVLLCRSQKEFKGIDYIKDALKRLNTDKPVTLVTTNVKGLLDDIKDKVNLVELGTINSEEEMAEVYNLCDVFLAPSTEESFGFMAVEAMSSEKPVIVFEGTALPDTVNAPEVGISTKRDSTALLKAIEHLLNHPEEVKKRGIAGRKFVLKTYTEEKYLKSYEKLFHTFPERKPINTESDKEPANIDKLSSFLAEKTTNIKFDYNNIAVQEKIRVYNHELYSKILKQSKKISPKKLVKRLLRIVRK